MKIWSDWGFTRDWWRGLRGEYWVIAQGILLLGFIILPTDTPSVIELEISAWQYIRWILTAIFGIGGVIILGQALMELGSMFKFINIAGNDRMRVSTLSGKIHLNKQRKAKVSSSKLEKLGHRVSNLLC